MRRVSLHKQQGFVSLFSVIFFMLFVTVITVGFLRIMTAEQRQALDNDLSASALAAAQSGVEDAKRAILRYYSMSPSDPQYTAFKDALTTTDCNALTASPSVRTALGLNEDGNIVGNSDINQSYSCLSVNLNSPDYESSSPVGVSDFIPLRTNNAAGFDQIKISWHRLSNSVGSEGDGIPANYAPFTQLPTTGTWNAQRYPAYLRVQLYGHPKDNFNRDELRDLSHTYVLIPGQLGTPGAVSANTPLNFGTDDPRGGAADPSGFDQTKLNVRAVQCLPAPGSNIGSYACTATLELPAGGAFSSNNNNYYMRVTPLYGQSHFRLVLHHNGSAVQMDGVQPIIDVTGKAEDVYRRLLTRVKVNPAGSLPEYAVESADTICKNMQVADNTYYRANSCP